MRLLDLFCGAGGAATGYHRAGFDEIVGVDIKPQPRYPFQFVQADALEFVKSFGPSFDAIHASPPCQRYSAGTRVNGTAHLHPDLVGPVRDALRNVGKPYAIENVIGAPLTRPLELCGSQFGLRGDVYVLRRHRLFELSVSSFSLLPPCVHQGAVIGVYGDHGRDRRRPAGTERGFQLSNETARREASAAMDIHWMNWRELSQAIPPAYTEYIGRQLLAHLQEAP